MQGGASSLPELRDPDNVTALSLPIRRLPGRQKESAELINLSRIAQKNDANKRLDGRSRPTSAKCLPNLSAGGDRTKLSWDTVESIIEESCMNREVPYNTMMSSLEKYFNHKAVDEVVMLLRKVKQTQPGSSKRKVLFADLVGLFQTEGVSARGGGGSIGSNGSGGGGGVYGGPGDGLESRLEYTGSDEQPSTSALMRGGRSPIKYGGGSPIRPQSGTSSIVSEASGGDGPWNRPVASGGGVPGSFIPNNHNQAKVEAEVMALKMSLRRLQLQNKEQKVMLQRPQLAGKLAGNSGVRKNPGSGRSSGRKGVDKKMTYTGGTARSSELSSLPSSSTASAALQRGSGGSSDECNVAGGGRSWIAGAAGVLAAPGAAEDASMFAVQSSVNNEMGRLSQQVSVLEVEKAALQAELRMAKEKTQDCQKQMEGLGSGELLEEYKQKVAVLKKQTVEMGASMRKHGVFKKMGMGTRWDSAKKLTGKQFIPNKSVDVTDAAVLTIKLRNSQLELQATKLALAKLDKQHKKEMDALSEQYDEVVIKSEARELRKARVTEPAWQSKLEQMGTPLERALAKVANAVLILEKARAGRTEGAQERYRSKEEKQQDDERALKELEEMNRKLEDTLALLEEARDLEQQRLGGKLSKQQQLRRLEQSVLLQTSRQAARSNSTSSSHAVASAGGDSADASAPTSVDGLIGGVENGNTDASSGVAADLLAETQAAQSTSHPDCKQCLVRTESAAAGQSVLEGTSLSTEDAALLKWARAHKKQIEMERRKAKEDRAKAKVERAKLSAMLAMATSHATTLVDSDRAYEQEFTEQDRIAHREVMAASGKHVMTRRASHFKKHVMQRAADAVV
jgi:hypothetical protein